MRIGPCDTDERVVVVAEIGNNHEGDVTRAEALVHAAAEAGADAVKFQTFRTEHYVGREDQGRFERLKGFELPYDTFEHLAALARSRGLAFVSTPFDLTSASFLAGVADALKIASGDNDFVPLLRTVAEARRPVVVSAGLADIGSVRRAVELVRAGWDGEDYGLAVLHCVSAYPVPDEQANLRAVTALADALDCIVGYSDHTLGLDAALLAVALGARIVEKHFTLDKDLSDFRDHRLSADPDDLRELVDRIRLAERLLGAGGKGLQPVEQEGLQAMRRSIVAARDLPAGHRLEAGDLTWVRPGGGMRPGEEDALVGRTLVRDVAGGERLARADVDG